MRQIFATLVGKPVIIILFLLTLFLMFVQLILANQLATSSQKLSQIFSEVERLERENRDSAVQIHQKGSILKLREMAAKQGFSEPKKFFFVRQNFLVAENLR